MNRNARRMAEYNQRKAAERGDWADEVETEQFGERPRARKTGKQTPRSQNFRGKKLEVAKPPTISDPAEMVLPKARTEKLVDEPLWSEGPYTGTQPVTRIFSQNMDFSTFPLLLERVYSDLEAENPRLRREVPYCAFQHVYSSLLSARLIDHVRTINAEDRYADEESPLNLVPDDMVIPAPIAEYYKLVANTTTPQGDLVKVNVPDAGIPQPTIPADEGVPALPSGTLGPVIADNHNKYECYVSPYVTSQLVIATRENTPDWSPLPAGAYPANAVPNTNLLGYRGIERLNAEGIQAISNFSFPNDDTMAGRLKWSPELVGRVSAHLGKLADRYKMVIGKPAHGTNSAAIGFTEVTTAGNTNLVQCTARLVGINAPVKSPVALGSNQCNVVGLFGLKRKRNAMARGLCYTVNGNAPQGWNATVNANFTMTAPFAPTIGADYPALRTSLHENVSPSGDRALALTTWTRRNFVIPRR